MPGPGDTIVHHAGDESIVLAQLIGILQLGGINEKGVETSGFLGQFRNATAKATSEFTCNFNDETDLGQLSGVHVANYSKKRVCVANIPLAIAKYTIENE